MMSTYYSGTLVRLVASFYLNGSGTDPNTVTASLKDPSGAITTLTTVKDGVGQYHADFTPTLTGVHYYRFVGSGTTPVTNEAAFVVTPSHVS